MSLIREILGLPMMREEILAMVAKGKRLSDANVGTQPDLRKADLRGANLKRVEWHRPDLRKADLSRAPTLPLHLEWLNWEI
jgi:uncharacterized protein YjbI with pentapeptide repeats